MLVPSIEGNRSHASRAALAAVLSSGTFNESGMTISRTPASRSQLSPCPCVSSRATRTCHLSNSDAPAGPRQSVLDQCTFVRYIAPNGGGSNAHRVSGARTRAPSATGRANPAPKPAPDRQNSFQTVHFCHPNRAISSKTLDFPLISASEKKFVDAAPIVVPSPRSDIARIRTQPNKTEQARTRSPSHPTEPDWTNLKEPERPGQTISRKTLEIVPRESAKNTGLNMETPL